MNLSECGKKRTQLNSRYYQTICLEGEKKNLKPGQSASWQIS